VAALAVVNGARRREYDQRKKAERAQAAEARQRRDAEEILYLNNVALANRESGTGNLTRVRQLLDQCPPRLRGWEWNYLDRLCREDLVTFRGHDGPVSCAAFSPDGARVASVGDDATVRVWDAATGRELLALKGHTAPLLGVAFSPDGRQIASAGRDATVRLWDAADGRPVRTLRGHYRGVSTVAYSPDGRLLASAGWDRVVRLWDAATGREVRTLGGFGGGVLDVAFSPDGRLLAAASAFVNESGRMERGAEVKVFEVATGEERFRVPPPGSATGYRTFSAVAFGPGGRLVLGGFFGGGGEVYDGAGMFLSRFRFRGTPTRVACSPNGRRLALANGPVVLPETSMTTSPADPGLVGLYDPIDGRECRLLQGHVDGITHLAFSADGRRLASTSLDGTVKVWDATAEPQDQPLHGHPGRVNQVVWSDDGLRLISEGGGQIRVWDAANGRTRLALRSRGAWSASPDGTRLVLPEGDRGLVVRDSADGRALRRIAVGGMVSDVVFSPDGRRLAAIVGVRPDPVERSERPGEVLVWEADPGTEPRRLRVGLRSISLVRFSPDGSALAYWGGDGLQSENPGQVLVWDVATGREQFALRSHPGAVYVLAFRPDGRRLVTAGRDQVARVWDPASGREVVTLRGHTGLIDLVLFSPDGRQIATRGSDSRLRLWDVATGRPVFSYRYMYPSREHFVAFSPDGRRLAAKSIGLEPDRSVLSGEIALRDTATGQELLTLHGRAGRAVTGAFSPGGDRLATGDDTGLVTVWRAPARRGRPAEPDSAEGRDAAPTYGPPAGPASFTLWGHQGAVNGVAFSPDGRLVATAGADRAVKVWEVGRRREVRTLRGHFDTVNAVAFSRDGTFIASSGAEVTKVWDAASGRERLTLSGALGGGSAVAFDPDSLCLAVATGPNHAVCVWDHTTGRKVYRLTGHTGLVTGLAFDPDGTRLVSAGSDRVLKLWDLTTGREDRTLRGDAAGQDPAPGNNAIGVAFSPDGRWLASGHAGPAVKVWDVADGRLARTLEGHTGKVTGLAFDPSGRRLATASEDETVKLWDLDTGREVHTFRGHTAAVTGVAFSPDGRWIASSSLDGTAEVWTAPAGSAADEAHGPERQDPQFYTRSGILREQFGRRAEAEADFTRAIERGAARTDLYLFIRRGHVRAEQGHWAEAEADFERLGVLNWPAWYYRALVRLELGDLEGYRRLCEAGLDRFERINNPPTTSSVAAACNLAPGSVADPSRLVRLVQREAARFPNEPMILRALGVSLFRAGRYRDALRNLDDSIAQSRDRQGYVGDWLFLAMTHHQLGHRAEARSWLEKAAAWIDEKEKERARPDAHLHHWFWADRSQARLLRREAEALINEGRPLYLPANVFQDHQARPAKPLE
jgi:WD40 repeat protein